MYSSLLKMHPLRRFAKVEAKKCLEKIFSPDPYDYFTVVKVLDNLKEMKSSPAKRQKDIFRCVIKEIFENRTFSPTYSSYQVMKMGHMFGGCIEYGLISNGELNEAYSFILDALKNSPESNMFSFGLIALDRIKHLLVDNHEYCYQITTIPHFNVFPSNLLKYVNSSKNQQKIEVFQKPITTLSQESPKIKKPINIKINTTDRGITEPGAETSVPLKVTTDKPLITDTVQIEQTLVEATKTQCNEITVIEPPETIQQIIEMIFDNMSQENVTNKCEKVKEVLEPRYLPWLSAFLTKRVCHESQIHSLYIAFVECYNSAPLNKLMKLETVRNIKVMTKKDKSPEMEISLKNMGHWLGLITLAQNKPVPFDLKKMIMKALKAYTDDGVDELSYILPFVIKILESCSKSKGFGPKKPWTESVLNCLAQLYLTPGMEFFFQHQIDVLCKMLNVELKDLLIYKFMTIKYYDCSLDFLQS